MLCHWIYIIICVSTHHRLGHPFSLFHVSVYSFRFFIVVVVVFFCLVWLVQFQFPFGNLFQCVTHKKLFIHTRYYYLCMASFSSICGINFLFIRNNRASFEWKRKYYCIHILTHTMNIGRIEKGSVNKNKEWISSKRQWKRHKCWWE